MARLPLLLLFVASCSSTAKNDTGGSAGTGAIATGGSGETSAGGSSGASGAGATSSGGVGGVGGLGGTAGAAGVAGQSGSAGSENDAGTDDGGLGCATPCASNTSCVAGVCKQVISLLCNIAACPPAYPHQMAQFSNLYECSSDECSADIHGGVVCTLDSDYAKGTVLAAACPPGTHAGTSVLDCSTGNSPAFCIPD